MEGAALDRGGAFDWCWRSVECCVTVSARENSPRNFLTIQALRAVAALLVVLLHAFETWGERVDPTALGVNWENGAAGVDIFFIISGFVMVISSRRLVDQAGAWLIFIRHRVVRIVPLYWLLTTVKILAVVALGGVVLRTGLDFNFVAGSYLFLPVTDSAGHFRPILPVGWTLTYEFLFYLLFAAALAIRIDVLRIVVPGLGLIAVAALVRTDAWPAWTILLDTIVVEFVFGVILAKWTLRGFRLPLAVYIRLQRIWIDPDPANDLRECKSPYLGHTGVCYRGRRRFTGTICCSQPASLAADLGRRIVFDLSQPRVCAPGVRPSVRQGRLARHMDRRAHDNPVSLG
jgi:Acyltransferase family